MPAQTESAGIKPIKGNTMSEPIFRYYDHFNEVYSKSSEVMGLTPFFKQYCAAKKAGNNPVLEQYIGRQDREDNPLFAGDIVKVSYEHPGNEGFPGGNTPGDYGHFLGVIRYQPSKGFVISRVIKKSEVDESEYEKKTGAMQFSVSHTTIVGNINQDPQYLKNRCQNEW